ncbi:type II secretion system F family protein [Prochlorococcus sp. MIT 0801]|uniref:type II secretion system F family protein n=1 Tax=Prochlorococcus sp. MIT 0801 TaxID=1501269 RepID=UPI0004F81A33|nr:type II secretion system F family protein [Prochlorococcus sp. MIT 0801]AIQ97334.1 Type II secretory pathway [Prochlorococcus sp. MIT 0801]
MPSYGENQLSDYSRLNNSNIRSQKSNVKFNPKDFKVSQNDLLVFFRQLAVIIQSGVPLAQGIELLSENTRDQKFSSLQVQISKRLSAGEELSTCFAKYPKVFPSLTVGLIEAGEAGGILDQILDRIASLIEQQAKIKSQIQGALIYPVIILVLALTVSLGLLIFIVPTFDKMFTDMGAELPAITEFMLTLSQIVTSIQFFIFTPIILIITSYLFSSYYKSRSGRFRVDSLILKIPLFGSLILRSEVASLCETLSTLIASGIPLVEAIQRCISASSNDRMKRCLSNGIQKVKEGQELSSSLDSYDVFPKLVKSMLKIGEETGRLGFMTENLANFYKREVEEAVSSLTKAMEPMVIMVVAGIVGTIVVSLYLPMFKMINVMG